MEGNDEDCGDAGAEALRRALVLRPLVKAYLNRTGSLESGIRDVTCPPAVPVPDESPALSIGTQT
jgi:hypothetical protein